MRNSLACLPSVNFVGRSLRLDFRGTGGGDKEAAPYTGNSSDTLAAELTVLERCDDDGDGVEYLRSAALIAAAGGDRITSESSKGTDMYGF